MRIVRSKPDHSDRLEIESNTYRAAPQKRKETKPMRQHLLEDIRSHALAKPDQLAVCDSEVSINYGDLDRFSTSLAMHLQAIGCKTGSRVVVVANRRAIMVAAILGTFKAGCIHVPLDSPHARSSTAIHPE